MKKVIAVLGPPGAGKDTQCKLISRKYKTKIVSIGKILRKEIKKKTRTGKKIQELMKKGDLIPDYIVKSIINKEIKNSEFSIILDGSPRDLTQVKMLDKINLVIFLNCTKKEITKRLLKRAKIEHRVDDTKKVIEHRWKIYEKLTKPVINFYKKRKLLREVNGNPSINLVFRQISPIIKKVLSEE
ncbi:nucleoside monophosphate kinase [Candidatus Woesearchaeota archaeon]|nr:nucleoside monophosphate kinase [Candidatus Woesearchaeota archaeon]